MSFAEFQASAREMTAAEYDGEDLPPGLPTDARLRVYAGGGVIVSTGIGWSLQLESGDRYTTARDGVTLVELERLLWMTTRHD